MTNIHNLFVGDPRAVALLEAITSVVYERGVDMPIPTILGVIELVKIQIINEAKP